MINYYNGEFSSSTDSNIIFNDRAFRYGDGVFETISIYNSIAYKLKDHYNRLTKGLDYLSLNGPTLLELESIINKLTKENNISKGIIRVQISRINNGRGFTPKTRDYNILAEIFNKVDVEHNEYSLIQSEYHTNSRNTGYCGSKLCSSLNYVLASKYAQQQGCNEAILTDNKNSLAECSTSNIFWIKNNIIHTPALSTNPIHGIIRKSISKLFDVKEAIIKIDKLLETDEVFVTNSNLIVQKVTNIKINDVEKSYQNTSFKHSELIKTKIEEDIRKHCQK